MGYNDDTIKLLRECDAGTKMAVASIDEVLSDVKDGELVKILQKSKKNHTIYGDELHTLLLEYDEEDKDPNPIAKGMSKIKTSMKMIMDYSDKTVADLMTDGCDMGTKSLHKYLNQYKSANDDSKRLCRKLIDIEDELRRDLREYL